MSSEDLSGEQAEAYGYVNRALPDAGLDAYVEALATRIAQFDKWAIANTKRLVNANLPPDVEIGAGWDACIASLGRPAAQNGIKALIERGLPASRHRYWNHRVLAAGGYQNAEAFKDVSGAAGAACGDVGTKR